jgi:hypothetical protein
MTVALLVVGCGGAGGPGGAAPAGGGDASLATAVTVSSSDERVPHGLAQGRYRIEYSAPDCDAVHLRVTPAAGGEPVYDDPNPRIAVKFVNNVEAGAYFIEQADPACTEWEIRMVRI